VLILLLDMMADTDTAQSAVGAISCMSDARGAAAASRRWRRVGFLPAETCFCQTSGLNQFKLAKSGKNRKPL